MKRFIPVVMICLVLVVLVGFSLIPAVASGTPQYGGTIIIDQPYGDVENLDPIVRGRMGAKRVTMNIFDGLVAFDPKTAAIVPAIASNWEITQDGTLYTFYLRDDAYFHNGRPIIAEDFVYSFERLADPESASPVSHKLDGVVGKDDFVAGRADHISGLQAIDDHTLQIQLEAIDATFINYLAWQALSVVPRETVEELGRDFGHTPVVGSGPFRFVDYRPDDVVILEAFDDYYKGRPYLDRIIFRLIPEAATKEAEFLAGNLDAFIVPAAIYRRFKDHPQYSQQMVKVAEFFTRHIGFHTEKEPFNDVRVRQAFNYAIDTEAIIEVILGGKGVPAVGFLPSSSYAFNPDMVGYSYNPERAKELMIEAGYGDGIDVPIMSSEHPEWGLPVVEAVMPYLSAVGIHLKPEVMDTGVLFDRLYAGDFISYIYSTGGDPHPADYLWRFHSDLSRTTNRYSDPELDRILAQARRTHDEDELIDLIAQAERIILRDAPVYFFHYNEAVMMYHDYVHGLQSAPIDLALQDMSLVWLDPQPER